MSHEHELSSTTAILTSSDVSSKKLVKDSEETNLGAAAPILKEEFVLQIMYSVQYMALSAGREGREERTVKSTVPRNRISVESFHASELLAPSPRAARFPPGSPMRWHCAACDEPPAINRTSHLRCGLNQRFANMGFLLIKPQIKKEARLPLFLAYWIETPGKLEAAKKWRRRRTTGTNLPPDVDCWTPNQPMDGACNSAADNTTSCYLLLTLL